MKRKYLFSIVLILLFFAILVNGFYQASEKNKSLNKMASLSTAANPEPKPAVTNPGTKPVANPGTVVSIKPPEPAKEDLTTAVPREISIKLKPGTDINKIPALKDKVEDVQKGYVYTTINLKPGVDPNKVLAEVQKDNKVEVAGSVHKYYPTATFDDPGYASEWHMPKINGPLVYDNAASLLPVKVAVVDTGVSGTHPDLAGKIISEYSVTQPVGPGVAHPTPTQGTFHGTHVAGIIAAQANNGTGVAGVAPNAQIMAIQVARDSTGLMYDFDIADGIYWAVDNGAKVINLSLGGDYSVNIHYAVNWALEHGVVVVAAAGNSNFNVHAPVVYPAALPGIIAVAATDSNDVQADFSNQGPEIAVAAPGEGILSTSWDAISGDVYASASGTSMSTPMVAAEAAIILGKNPNLTVDEVRQLIEQNADEIGPPGKDNFFGYGRINTYKALSATPGLPPKMNIETPVNGSVIRGKSATISGWALNSSDIAAVYILKGDGSNLGMATIGLSRADVNAAIPGYLGGSQSGFSFSLDTTQLPNGWQTIRVVPTGKNGQQIEMSRTVYVDNSPKMNIDSPANGSVIRGKNVTVSGWALNSSDIAAVYVLKGNGSNLGMATIGLSRTDVNAVIPGYEGGSQSGFSFTLDTTKLPNGWQPIRIVPTGKNGQQIEMSTMVYVDNLPPIGHIESPGYGSVIRGKNVTVSGWALNSSDIAAVYVLKGDGSNIGAATVGLSRPDVNAVIPGYDSGSQSGFSFTLDTTKLPNGWQPIRIIPTGKNGQQIEISTMVYVDNLPPRAHIDSPAGGSVIRGKNVTVSGWALNSSDIGAVYVLSGSNIGMATIGLSRTDVNAVFPGYEGGSQSGFSFTLDTTKLPNGWQPIRIIPTGKNGQQIEISTMVYVDNLPSRAHIDSPAGGSVIRGKNVTVSGWALNSSDIGAVYVLSGSNIGMATIGLSRTDVNAVFPGYEGGSQSGFSFTLDTTKLPNGWQPIRIIPTGKNGQQIEISTMVYVDNSPKMNIDSPGNGSVISGNSVIISGWALNSSDVAAVYILKGDGSNLGFATIGLSRPDVDAVIPGYLGGSQSGFSFDLDTTLLPNGWQTIRVVPTGKNGQQIEMSRTYYINN